MSKLNQKGFSLVETLIAAGIAGGLSLTIAKLGQESNKVSKTSETNTEISNILSDVSYILSDKASCNATLGVSSNIGTDITAIRRVVNSVSSNVYQLSPKKYSSGLISFKNITTEASPGGVNLVMTITRENLSINGAKEITKRIPLKAIINAGKIESCFSDTESMIETAAKMACQGNSARWDDVNKECHHTLQNLICTTGKVMQQIVTDAGEIKAECVPIIPTPMNCPQGSFLKSITIDGTITCAPMETTNCGIGQYAHKLTNGNLDCKNIPRCNGNQSLLRADPSTGELICVSLACNPTNQYFAGLDPSGSAICKTFPDTTCGPGQYIKEVHNNGTVVCATVPNHLSLPKADFSFVDGFDAGLNQWSRKDVNQIAQQVCGRLVGFSWNGTSCVPPVSAAGSTPEDICTKFVGHEWTGYSCRSATTFSKLVAFQLRFNGSSWSVGSTRIIHSDYASDRNISVVLTSTTKINAIDGDQGSRYNFRLHHDNYYMDSAEIISAQLIGPRGPQTDGKKTMKITVTDIDGNNVIELVKSDDATENTFQPGDIVNIVWGTPRL